VEAWVHETAAARLLGQPALDIERHAAGLVGYLSYQGAGAEARGRSAIDIALWDLLGKACGQPLYRLLGGRTHDPVRIYNTCAGPDYARREPEQSVQNWGMPQGRAAGRYDDLDAFLHRPDELARDLLEDGVTAMKIWPLDPYAEASRGRRISVHELEQGLEPLRRIRDAVGKEMEILVELHGLWDAPMARHIVRALEPFEPRWVEDPLRNDQLDALADLAARSPVPIAVGETLAGSRAFDALLARLPLGLAIVDLSWCGGISEARRIAAAAESRGIPIAAHDCTGPVVLTASTHFSTAIPNALVQETVRAFYRGWYADLVTALPLIERGTIVAPDGPGLGTELRADVRERPDAHARSSRLDEPVLARVHKESTK
jgi:L-alanine-DL-glutamate epimerase-like enolase superfamily enzyme